MLKAMVTGTKDGTPCKLIVLGLSHRNLERLKNREPIRFTADEFGWANTDIFIFAGETEQSMGREIAELVGPETKVTIDPRLRD